MRRTALSAYNHTMQLSHVKLLAPPSVVISMPTNRNSDLVAERKPVDVKDSYEMAIGIVEPVAVISLARALGVDTEGLSDIS